MLVSQVHGVIVNEEAKTLSASFYFNVEGVAIKLGDDDKELLETFTHCALKEKTLTAHRIWLVEAMQEWAQMTGGKFDETKVVDIIHDLGEFFIKHNAASK